MTTQTKYDEELKLALQALKDNQHLVADNERHAYVMEYNSMIEKCEQTLAQQSPQRSEDIKERSDDNEQVEPVGVVCVDISNAHMMYGTQYLGQQPDKKTVMLFKDLKLGTQLYTTPPQRTWVEPREWRGLTDEDFLEACRIAERGNYLVAFQRIQAKLKEKNNGT